MSKEKVKAVSEQIDIVGVKNEGGFPINDTKPDAIVLRSQSSVEITKDAKGNIKFCIKVYDDNPFEAAKKATEIYEQLEEGLE